MQQSYMQLCGKLTASEVKCLEFKEGRVLKFLCPECVKSNTFTLLHAIIEDKKDLINSKEKTITILKQIIAELREKIDSSSLKPTTTYSQIVKGNKETVVLIKPKDTTQTSVNTRNNTRTNKSCNCWCKYLKIKACT